VHSPALALGTLDAVDVGRVWSLRARWREGYTTSDQALRLVVVDVEAVLWSDALKTCDGGERLTGSRS